MMLRRSTQVKHIAPAGGAALIALALGSAPLAHAVPGLGFDELNIISDSLSDQGLFESINLDPVTGETTVPPPYNPVVGRFSSGPVWADQIQTRFPGLTINNRSLGGAMVNTYPVGTEGQTFDSTTDVLAGFNFPQFNGIEAQLANHGPISPDSRTVLWAGGNDIAFIGAPGAEAAAEAAGPAGAAQFVQDFVASLVGGIVRSVQSLAALGADLDDIYVVSVPDIGLAPIGQDVGPAGAAALSQLTLGFNAAVAAALSELAPEVEVIDMNAAFNTLLDDPSVIGVTETIVPCVTDSGVCSDPESRIFWDFVHPSSATHGFITDTIVAAVGEPVDMPLPAPMLLVALGLAGMTGARVLSETR